jgi:serine/threonine protein kinase
MTSEPSIRGAAKVRGQRFGFDVPGLELTEELGRGAHSVVFRAHRDGAPYAVKVLHSRALDTRASLAAFNREATLLAGINHPRLARVHEVGVTNGHPYLVMDLVEGRELAEVIAERPLSPEQVISLGLDLAGALIAVHHRDLVNRDIKTRNVMVDADGTARLIDFGPGRVPLKPRSVRRPGLAW